MGLSLKRPAQFQGREPRQALRVDTHMLLPGHDDIVPVAIKNVSNEAENFVGQTRHCFASKGVPLAASTRAKSAEVQRMLPLVRVIALFVSGRSHGPKHAARP